MFQNPLRPSICAAFLALAAIAGCSGGGGGKGSSLAAPTSFSVKWSESYPGSIELAWTPPSQTFDGYNVEGQVGSAGFVKLNTDGLLPSTWSAASFQPDTAALPELATFSFRMNCQRGTEVSGYSNTSSVTTRLRAPSNVYVNMVPGGYQVTWINNSTVADTLTLERGVGTSYSATDTVWTPIPSVTFGALQYADSGAPEGVYLSYRVTYAKGQASASSVSSATQTSLSAPINLVATPGYESVHLTWTNRSASAGSVVVSRASGLDAYPSFSNIATLAATATSYDDLQLATGYYVYRVEARLPAAGAGSQSPVAKVATLPAAVPGLTVTPSILQLPPSSSGTLAPDGTWILGNLQTYSNTSQVYYPSGGTWATQTFANANAFVTPGVLADASSRPHVVYTRIVTQGTSEVALVHAWFEGSAWQSEEITRTLLGASYDGTPLTRLDANGHPVVVFTTSSGGLVYAYKAEDGTWKTENLASALPANLSPSYLGLALDSAGAPVVLVNSYNASCVLRRTGASAWVSETLPSVSTSFLAASTGAIAVTADGDLHVFTIRQNYPYTGGYDLAWSRRTAGGWTLPTAISTVSGSGYAIPVQASPAGDRLAVAYPTSQGNQLLTYLGGAWTKVILGPNLSLRPYLGFTSQGKVRALQCTGYGYATTPIDCVLYSEP